ncbi:MAG TPA: site-2 protease family protein [Candidatus Paceibacterota bacterium]|nr:site-2 protease family protein [Candidatus Paceibacterota bacterium]
MGPDVIILIIVLIASIVLHEVAHGYAAYKLGDPTAKLQGRLTLNPIVHMDPMMSVIVPGLLVLSGSPFLFGAARPVPYNPYNFTDQKYGEAKVAAAGPAVNLLIAVIFGALIQLSSALGLSETFVQLSFQIIVLNIFLAFFNMLPIPPLDGSKVLPIFLPFDLKMKYQAFRNQLEQNIALAFLIVFGLIFFVLGQPLYYATLYVAQLLAGF